MQKLKSVLKIGDFIIIGILSLLIILSFLVYRILPDRGRSVFISVNGRQVYRLSLSTSREISIKGPLGETRIHVEDGRVWVTKAPCPHKICVKMGKISRSGEIIVCVPNRILIEVEGGEEREIDSITM